jgi:hypothetical protein
MRAPLAISVVLLAACGGTTAPQAAASGDASAAGVHDGSTEATSETPTPCSWPPSLNPPEAGPQGWSVAHYFLSCSGEGCLSSEPNTCPGGTSSGCTDVCTASEYAVAVGGPPEELPDGAFAAPPKPVLPPSCRFAATIPSGTEFLCCACE